MRVCPKCGAQLVPAALGNLMVDGCPGCGGIWFDYGELAKVAQAGSTGSTVLEASFNPGGGYGPGGTMSCPSCGAPLHEFEFQHSPGIKLDGCSQCKGIWVDDGELAAIQRRVDEAAGRTYATPTQALPQHRARPAIGFLVNFACPQCKEMNPVNSLTCWACGLVFASSQTARLCPVCDVPLQQLYSQGLALDGCTLCGGVWLDGGEMAQLLERSDEGALQALQAHLDAVPPALTRRPVAYRKCPTCRTGLMEYSYQYATGIRLNKCATCKGTWADRGELLQVYRLSQGFPFQQPDGGQSGGAT
jgi:Zn-finger nucleic acid-binding protein